MNLRKVFNFLSEAKQKCDILKEKFVQYVFVKLVYTEPVIHTDKKDWIFFSCIPNKAFGYFLLS